MTRKQKKRQSNQQRKTAMRSQRIEKILCECMEELADIAAIQEYERRKAAGEVSYRELTPAEIAEWASDAVQD